MIGHRMIRFKQETIPGPMGITGRGTMKLSLLRLNRGVRLDRNRLRRRRNGI
jgi:hypothetical protein